MAVSQPRSWTTGQRFLADACVVTVPHDVLLKMAPKGMTDINGPLEGLRHIKTSPITGVHFWLDRKVMTVPFLSLLDHTVQWVFNKSALYASDETPARLRI